MDSISRGMKEWNLLSCLSPREQSLIASLSLVTFPYFICEDWTFWTGGVLCVCGMWSMWWYPSLFQLLSFPLENNGEELLDFLSLFLVLYNIFFSKYFADVGEIGERGIVGDPGTLCSVDRITHVADFKFISLIEIGLMPLLSCFIYLNLFSYVKALEYCLWWWWWWWWIP